jgi:hypothetical protein
MLPLGGLHVKRAVQGGLQLGSITNIYTPIKPSSISGLDYSMHTLLRTNRNNYSDSRET